MAGVSLLGVLLVAVFALSGTGVRDLRSQVVAAVSTLVAAIVGFYFGQEGGGGLTGVRQEAPELTGTRREGVARQRILQAHHLVRQPRIRQRIRLNPGVDSALSDSASLPAVSSSALAAATVAALAALSTFRSTSSPGETAAADQLVTPEDVSLPQDHLQPGSAVEGSDAAAASSVIVSPNTEAGVDAPARPDEPGGCRASRADVTK